MPLVSHTRTTDWKTTPPAWECADGGGHFVALIGELANADLARVEAERQLIHPSSCDLDVHVRRGQLAPPHVGEPVAARRQRGFLVAHEAQRDRDGRRAVRL